MYIVQCIGATHLNVNSMNGVFVQGLTETITTRILDSIVHKQVLLDSQFNDRYYLLSRTSTYPQNDIVRIPITVM